MYYYKADFQVRPEKHLSEKSMDIIKFIKIPLPFPGKIGYNEEYIWLHLKSIQERKQRKKE
jgi:hypothetical protein